MLPDLSAFECKLCIGRDIGNAPVHTKWLHYGTGIHPVYEYEWIIDRRITPEDDKEYCTQVDTELWPWTLENLTGFFIKRGYTVVWMRRTR